MNSWRCPELYHGLGRCVTLELSSSDAGGTLERDMALGKTDPFCGQFLENNATVIRGAQE